MAGIIPTAVKETLPAIVNAVRVMINRAPSAAVLLAAYNSGSSNGGAGSSSGGSGATEHNSNGRRRTGSGDGGGIDFNAKWKELEAVSPCIACYNNIKLVQTEDGRYWFTKDSAGHGGARAKCYEDNGSKLVFLYSVDENFYPIHAKHESMKYPVIKKKDLNVVRKLR